MYVYTEKYAKYFICKTCGNFQVEYYESCCNEPTLEFVRFLQTNGVFTLRKICRNCDRLHSQAFKKDLVNNFSALSVVDNSVNDTHYEHSRIEREEFFGLSQRFKQAAINREAEERREFYTSYIQSSEWKQRREVILKRDNYLCQGCLRNPAAQVHHTTYDHLGQEFAFELISLCEPCHKRYHNL